MRKSGTQGKRKARSSPPTSPPPPFIYLLCRMNGIHNRPVSPTVLSKYLEKAGYPMDRDEIRSFMSGRHLRAPKGLKGARRERWRLELAEFGVHWIKHEVKFDDGPKDMHVVYVSPGVKTPPERGANWAAKDRLLRGCLLYTSPSPRD